MGWLEPVTLTGTHASLVPLTPGHAQALGEASNEDGLWRVWYTNVPSPDGMAAEIERRLGSAWRSARPGTPAACSAARSTPSAS